MYKIIAARDESELSKVVSEHLRSGWRVTGGVSHKDGRIFQVVYMEKISLWASFKKWFFRNLYKRET